MSRQFDYRSTWPYPADEVYAAMVDPDYLRARLARIGGPGAALLEHHVDPDGVHYRLRHGLDPKDMPAVIRTVLPGDITIEREGLRIYIPLATMLLVSVVASLLLALVNRR